MRGAESTPPPGKIGLSNWRDSVMRMQDATVMGKISIQIGSMANEALF